MEVLMLNLQKWMQTRDISNVRISFTSLPCISYVSKEQVKVHLDNQTSVLGHADREVNLVLRHRHSIPLRFPHAQDPTTNIAS